MDVHNSTSIPLEPLPLADCFAKNLSLQQTSLPGGTANLCERHVVFYYLLHQPRRQDRVWGLALTVVSCLSCSEASFTGIVNVQSFVDRRKRGACGVSAPHAEVLLFRQKDPKPWAPGRGPWGAFAPVPKVRAAELASLRQSSPPNKNRERGAATPAGALRWRHGMAGV